jgi:hypothetical protein
VKLWETGSQLENQERSMLKNIKKRDSSEEIIYEGEVIFKA